MKYNGWNINCTEAVAKSCNADRIRTLARLAITRSIGANGVTIGSRKYSCLRQYSTRTIILMTLAEAKERGINELDDRSNYGTVERKADIAKNS